MRSSTRTASASPGRHRVHTQNSGHVPQVRRAALSIPTNIAEGAAKTGEREFARFLNISLGSLSELCYLLRFNHDRGLLSDEEWRALESRRDLAGRLVYGLFRKLRSQPHQ